MMKKYLARTFAVGTALALYLTRASAPADANPTAGAKAVGLFALSQTPLMCTWLGGGWNRHATRVSGDEKVSTASRGSPPSADAACWRPEPVLDGWK